MTVDVFIADAPVDVHITGGAVDVFTSDDSIDIHVGFDGGIGPEGPVGPPGGGGFDFTQASPSAEWVVNHNLGFRPSCSVLTPGGVEMLAGVSHVSDVQLRVRFSSPQVGSVRCI